MSPSDGQPPWPSGKIRVLFVTIEMSMGGTERLIFNLAKHLDRRVFEPSIAWLANDQPVDEFERLGIPLHYVPKRRRMDWATMKRLARIIEDQRIDVVNAHHFLSFFYAYYAAKVANRARLVYTEHSEADVLNASRAWQIIGGYLLRQSDAVVGVSEKVSRALETHFDLGGEMVHTIENGVDVGLFNEGGDRRAQLRKELGFAPDDFVIGHVANFRRNKNHLFLLKAFREIARRKSGVKLALLGQGFPGDRENSEPEVTSFIKDNALGDSVRLMGYRPNVQESLCVFDVSVLLSYKEGLPLSLIEAMASGLPVVGTDIEGIRGVIVPEVNGLTVAPDDISALTSVLTRLLGDAPLRRRLGTSGRKIAAEKYSLTRCVRETQQLFRSLLPQHMDSLCDEGRLAQRS